MSDSPTIIPRHITVVSAFRNSSTDQVVRWHDQCVALQKYFFSFNHVAVTGDNADNGRTVDALSSCWPHPLIIEHHHGGKHFGSTEHPDRMRTLSGVGNAMLDSVAESESGLVLYVESDLIWSALTIARLYDRMRLTGVDAIVPLIMAGDHFYDVWAYRCQGTRFSPFYPYLQPWPYPYLPFESSPTTYPIDSVGSCILMTAKLAADKRVRMSTGALVEWSTRARDIGYTLGVGTDLVVRHPA